MKIKKIYSKACLDGLVKLIVVASLLLPLSNVYAQEDLDSKYATELPKPGTIAPAFTLTTLDGKTVSLSDFKGKYVVLDFWASWCPDCLRDITEVQSLYKDFSKRGVVFVGVSFDNDKSRWQAAVEKYDIQYLQCSELKKMRKADIAKQYGVKWIPSLVVVDPEGKIALSTVLSSKVRTFLSGLF